MKKAYKFMGLCIITIFSFYYTDKIVMMVQASNPIMKEIETIKQETDVKTVNAIIDDDYIIPGKNGLEVNSKKSFEKMKSFGLFNSYYLIYDQIKPDINLDSNKDKIIKRGNPTNNNVSIIIESKDKLVEYFEQNNIYVNVLISKEEIISNFKFELINNDFINYNYVDSFLSKNNSNKQLCFLKNKNNFNFCKEKNKFLIEETYEFNNNNVSQIKAEIKSGDIIFINANTDIENIKILLNQIKFRGINLVFVSELISEESK